MKFGTSSPRLLVSPPAGILVLMSLAVIAASALMTAAAAAPKACQSKEIVDLRAELGMADDALERLDYRRANDVAKAAISKIGNRYFQQSMIDDTGLSLSLADSLETQNDLQHAANIRVRMGHSRLDALARNHGC